MNADTKNDSQTTSQKMIDVTCLFTAALPPFGICVYLRPSAVKIK